MASPAPITADAWPAALDQMADVLEGPIPRPAMQRCAELIREDFAENYVEGRNEEAVWPEHSPATVARYGPHPLLILSGRMREATITKGAAGNVEEIGDREMALGVEGIVYAPTQNWGDPSRNIPQREFIVPRAAGLDQCEEVLADAMLDAMGF